MSVPVALDSDALWDPHGRKIPGNANDWPTSSPPMQGRGTDALTAFLHYFEHPAPTGGGQGRTLMPRFLITLSLGPVQSLIADARRTRDLWCGSWLLSEAARAAARTLHERHPACLIFPCPDNPDEDLERQDAPREAANIANVLRAEVALANRTAVLALCDEAKRAAALRVEELGERARQQLGSHVREEVWRAQIDDVVETFAAWVEIAEGDDGYYAASERLGATLNARKATRDFQPCSPLTVAGLPKSSLDGARETVLPDWPAEEPARVRLGLSPREQLDALGVIKRLAGDAEQFTALPRIAADSWIQCNSHPASSNGCRQRTSHWSTRVTRPASAVTPTPTPRCRSTAISCTRPGWRTR